MVGVPGKYKGCETCRRRRVKCSNERPYCQKCINSGRQCEGYERERVFITGTPETKGRVASHPRKAASSSSSARRQRLKVEAGSTPELTTPERTPEREPLGVRSFQGVTTAQPLTSAWEDYITLRRSQGSDCYALMTALQAPLQGMSTDDADSSDGEGFRIALAPYTPPELPMMTGSNVFNTSARCLVHLSGADDGEEAAESFCVFLFEHTLETSEFGFSQPLSSPVQRMGAQNFTSFPNHHFLVRVYRPMTISAALLSRRATFLSEADWTTTPWVRHPKSLLDQLLDMIAYLPTLLERADRIAPLQATLSRRHEAEKILHSCLALERRFDHWLQMASQGTTEQPLRYWAEEMSDPGGGLPFPHSYAFCDGVTGIMFLYYWMSQIPFHRCIDSLYGVIFQPVMDSYPDMWPDLPPSLQLEDPTRYTQTRELAANVCRGLDSALAFTAQPDMLVAPMTIALDLYRDVNANTQDGLLEILWLEAFRGRLVDKGQHVSTVLQRNSWVEIARY